MFHECRGTWLKKVSREQFLRKSVLTYFVDFSLALAKNTKNLLVSAIYWLFYGSNVSHGTARYFNFRATFCLNLVRFLTLKVSVRQ